MTRRSMRASVAGVAMITAGVVASPAIAATPLAPVAASIITDGNLSVVRSSLPTTTDLSTSAFRSGSMSVEVALAPSHEAQLQGLLGRVYDAKSRSYQHWLKRGQFDSRFAPSRTETSAVVRYLKASGLVVERSASPFLVRATGSSSSVSSAFHTTLRVYRDTAGTAYYSNASAVQLPTGLVGGLLGVIGLSDTIRVHSMIKHVRRISQPAAGSNGSTHGCETPYVTTAELFDFFNSATYSFPYGYGGGPGCSGLTPSQTNSIYGAPEVGPRGEGAGVNLAVFELSAYQHSDIDTWARTFYGHHYTPPLVDINVDGGPLSPICPAGDTCPPEINGYSGDSEVAADVEMQLSISPDARRVLVYNAPNDYTGQTVLDEYTQIANDDAADVVSSSWGLCERDVGDAAYVQAENVVFEQMASQGQSMFAAAGDQGPFDCIDDGTPNPDQVNVDDPGAQPWVTSVGGTSLETDNPAMKARPSYPTGLETVWNQDDLCNTTANEGGVPGGYSGYPLSGYFWCSQTGASGGGSSEYWGRPSYQRGKGVDNPYTTYGDGTTQCSLAAAGTPCREVPDVSSNADPYTGPAEYCTGDASLPYSACATFNTVPTGWFQIGGTSLSSPLWSGIIADRDSFQGHRTGNANPLLYLLFNTAPSRYFHDVGTFSDGSTTPGTNGLFPTTPGYDEATGIGTPIMDALITRSAF